MQQLPANLAYITGFEVAGRRFEATGPAPIYRLACVASIG
jgi:hypothetical protein